MEHSATLQLLSAEQCYQALGYNTVSALREAARIGLVPSVRIGRRRKFNWAQLTAWAESGGTPLTEEKDSASTEAE
jgi:hypothetical protein